LRRVGERIFMVDDREAASAADTRHSFCGEGKKAVDSVFMIDW
jgi:hypothetical protein